MTKLRSFLFLFLFATQLFGDGGGTAGPLTVRISSETAPPNGVAQMKLLLTAPKPISTGFADLGFDSSSIDIWGIALFNNTGDVSGAAVVSGNQIQARFTSPNATFGASTDYPLLGIAMHVNPQALPGAQMPVSFDVSSWLLDATGANVPIELKPGTLTVGGSISITNVLPGGGFVQAGSTVRILGQGFSKNTKLRMDPLGAGSFQVVSPNEIRVTMKDSGVLDGNLIQVVNPDNSASTYYSYMRGVPVWPTSTPLLAETVPLFSISTSTNGSLGVWTSPVDSNSFTALALQNPNPSDVQITLQEFQGSAQIGGSGFVLQSGTRVSRTVAELFGSNPPVGSVIVVSASAPVQMLGLTGNNSTGAVMPVKVF